MDSDNFIKNILKDIRVDLTDEFDRNFERKAFFDKAWEDTRIPNRKGSLMMRTGKTRRSIKSTESPTDVKWTSSLPYANMLNEGGEIVVTEKMKRFFWAMFYKASGAVTSSGKGERNARLSEEAKTWKALALQKVGKVMIIKQRQFIGDHPEVRRRIEAIVDQNMQAVKQDILNNLRR
jgi:phage gpG-like protein